MSTESTARDLPTDVIIDILSRVPVRSLLRFKCVCKSWYALLKNPNFTTKHFDQITSHTTTTSNSSFLYMRRCSNVHNHNRFLSLLSSNETLEVPIPFLSTSDPLQISGTCNGLVCLSVMPFGPIILLWNPATSEVKDLPISPVARPQAVPSDVVLGFGFDPNTNDYKVLRVVLYWHPPLIQVEVYSLSSNSWREIKDLPISTVRFSIHEHSCRVFVRGRLHWKSMEIGALNWRPLIVSFHMGDEVFHHISLPDYWGGYYDVCDAYRWDLVAMKESLAVFFYPPGKPCRSFHLWVMNEYGVENSWTKCISFGPHPSVHTPLGCGNNGEVLLLDKDNMVLYDLLTHELKAVQSLPTHDILPCCSQVFTHMETLLPIKGGKVVEETSLGGGVGVAPDLYFVKLLNPHRRF